MSSNQQPPHHAQQNHHRGTNIIRQGASRDSQLSRCVDQIITCKLTAVVYY